MPEPPGIEKICHINRNTVEKKSNWTFIRTKLLKILNYILIKALPFSSVKEPCNTYNKTLNKKIDR